MVAPLNGLSWRWLMRAFHAHIKLDKMNMKFMWNEKYMRYNYENHIFFSHSFRSIAKGFYSWKKISTSWYMHSEKTFRRINTFGIVINAIPQRLRLRLNHALMERLAIFNNLLKRIPWCNHSFPKVLLFPILRMFSKQWCHTNSIAAGAHYTMLMALYDI